MRYSRSTPNEPTTRPRGWRGTATAIGLAFSLLVLASCGSTAETTADAAAESQPAPAVERIAEPEPDCGPVATNLTDAIDAAGADCLFTAPASLTADVAGELELVVSSSPADCLVEVDGTDAASTLVLDGGETVTLSAADAGACRFQLNWTPTPAAPTTTEAPATTTTAAPTTTSTTTTTTTTTTVPPTTTKKPTPPPTTTSAVGS